MSRQDQQEHEGDAERRRGLAREEAAPGRPGDDDVEAHRTFKSPVERTFKDPAAPQGA